MLRQSFRVYGSIVLEPDELFSQIWSDLKSSLDSQEDFWRSWCINTRKKWFWFCFQTISSNLRTTSGRRSASALRRLSPIFRRKTKFEESDSTLLARSSLLQKTEQVWGNSIDFQGEWSRDQISWDQNWHFSTVCKIDQEIERALGGHYFRLFSQT